MAPIVKSARTYEEIDELDRQIIEALKEDGRASNQRLAARLGLSPTAVGARIRRLERDQVLRVALVADFDVIGCELLLTLSIKVEQRDAGAVARELAALPEVFSCSVMIGAYNLEALVALPNVESLKQFIEVDLAAICGISEVSVDVAVDMLKYDFDVVPFTS